MTLIDTTGTPTAEGLAMLKENRLRAKLLRDLLDAELGADRLWDFGYRGK